MNLLLLSKDAFDDAKTVRVSGRRYVHLMQILKVKVGDCVRVGVRSGKIGIGRVCEIHPERETIVLDVTLDRESPPNVPTWLILAMPRPLMLKRILTHAVSLGIERLSIIGSARVEKSYFHTPLLQPEAIDEQVTLALEQAIDTRVPEIEIIPSFRDFFSRRQAMLDTYAVKLLAHPEEETSSSRSTPLQSSNIKRATHEPSTSFSPFVKGGGGIYQSIPLNAPVALAIGPEGGFIPLECEQFKAAQFFPFTMGPRILRVETAVCAALMWIASRRLNE